MNVKKKYTFLIRASIKVEYNARFHVEAESLDEAKAIAEANDFELVRLQDWDQVDSPEFAVEAEADNSQTALRACGILNGQ